MKKLAILLTTTSAIVVGGYTGLWFYNAGNIKKEAEDVIGLVQVFTGADGLSYSSLGTSGYPGKIVVDINKVKFNILSFYKGDIEHISIGRGVFCNTLTLSGSDQTMFEIGPFIPGEVAKKLQYKTSNGSTFATLTFKGSNFGEFLKGKLSLNPFKDKEFGWDLLDSFKSYETKNDGGELSDSQNSEVYYKSGPTYAKFTLDRLDEDSHDISLVLSIKDQEFTPAFDKYIHGLVTKSGLVALLSSDPRLSTIDLENFNLSVNGKTDMEIDVSYRGLTNLTPGKDGKIDLQIQQFDRKDDLQKSTLTGSVKGAISKAQDIQTLNVNFSGTYQADAKFDEYLKTVFASALKRQLAAQAGSHSDTEQGDSQEANAITAVIGEAVEKYAGQIFPDFHTLGEMKYSADLNYGDPADSLEIRTISLQTEKGGLTAKGWVKNIKGPNATYSVHLTLNNYEELITGLVEYASALAKVYDEMSNNATPTKIDASLKDDLIKFIKENADEGEKGSKDLVLTFTHENDKYMIGKMEASQVFMALMLLVMPK